VIPALVLTAGRGTRLDPLTRLVAKPAVPVAGRPLVVRVLEWLGRQGVRDVVLNLHHRPETITGLIGDGTHLGLRVRYSWEPEILGSAGGPRHALPLLDAATFLIINGDTLCDVELSPMIAAHDRTGAQVTLALVPNPAPDHYNGLLLDEADRVRGVLPKGQRDPQPSWHFVGVQVAQATVFAPLADGVPAETIAELYGTRMTPTLGTVGAWRVEVPFHDIGTPRDYLETTLAIAGAAPDGRVIEAGAHVDRSASVVHSVVWPGAHVAGGVELADCVVAGGVDVPPGFRARQAVLVPASVLRADEQGNRVGDVAVFAL
jgi:mannose-1-phosphate guanylyltransferase